MLLEALNSGSFGFPIEAVRAGKNLLQTGELSLGELIRILKRCRGPDYSVSPHHWIPEVVCHVFKPTVDGHRWYVKCCFIEQDTLLISVHKSEH
ncbi:MAG: hypothetical protein ABL977_03510 [Candidatus Eisenbacteria bacterium]